MERLHIGDLVRVTLKTTTMIGIICDIHKHNNESIDNCIYGIAYENPELEKEVDIMQKVAPSCDEIIGRCYWFDRQEIKLLKYGYRTYKIG